MKLKRKRCADLVVIHGSVIHRSERNLSQLATRFIYTFHMIDSDATWDELNWSVRFSGRSCCVDDILSLGCNRQRKIHSRRWTFDTVQ